jgi:hypothetical protein
LLRKDGIDGCSIAAVGKMAEMPVGNIDQNHSQRFLRQTPGVVPTYCMKTRVKWL